MKVLAIETSCDESAVAILKIEKRHLNILASRIASQVEEHNKWGGVVPEIASRRHLEALPFLLQDSLLESGQKIKDIDFIAATVAPGLAGSLMVGSMTARALASFNQIPFVGVHHLEGHLASALLSEKPPKYPYLVLLVSGGHTELIHCPEKGRFQSIGRSHDDAAGEAFDKVARLLGLPYPGGPAIEKKALLGDPFRFTLPKGKVSCPEGGFYPYDFSFSGLKTAMLRKVESFRNNNLPLPIEDLAASFQRVVAEVLTERSIKCALDLKVKNLVMVGGVAANQYLRKSVIKKALAEDLQVSLAPKEFCTDNAAMIGAAALLRLESGKKVSSLELGVSPRWPLEKADLLYNQTPPF